MGASDAYTRNRLETLGTALVCDVLDSLGHRTSFLGPQVMAMWPAGPMAGWAVTIECHRVEPAGSPNERPNGGPYGVLFEALAERHDGAVLVIRAGDRDSGVWGELLSVAARARGIVGVVTDGLTRDLTAITELEFPIHATGTSPTDSAGRQDFVAHGSSIEMGGITVTPGDWIVADELGAVVVPAQTVDRVIELGEEKQRGESVVRAELEAGDDLGEVFRRHGIL